ncbi:MAG: hypothetical protein KIT73_06840, partial [Burkholderiales bacterium]|nr:hypothetical protein [Burkholderiales bacterium]
QAAFEQRDPKRLMGVYSDLHAAAVATLQQILVTIAADGVKLETVEWYVDRESGELVVAEYVDDQGQRRQIRKVEAHPLFRPLGELISRLNISLSDLGMTVKVFDDAEAQMGALAQTADERESMAEFARRQAIAVENLAALVDRANKASKADPILIEYEQEQGEQGGQ